MIRNAQEAGAISALSGVASGLFLSLDERVNDGVAVAAGLGIGATLLLILGGLALVKKA
jgi:hypothetical protein